MIVCQPAFQKGEIVWYLSDTGPVQAIIERHHAEMCHCNGMKNPVFSIRLLSRDRGTGVICQSHLAKGKTQ